MKNVRICRLGCFNHNFDFGKLTEWQSKYFKVSGISLKADIDVDHFEDDYIYPTQKIAEDMGNPEAGVDLLVAIVDQPLEGSFYMHRIDSNRAVLSVFPVLDILTKANIPIENYIIRCIYEMIVFLYEGGGRVDDGIYMIPHHETRGCLFDMNVFIDRIIYSSVEPIICAECKTRLRARPLPDGFIEGIEKELSRIKKTLYYRVEERIKRHPIVALLIASAFAVMLNIAASFIYEGLKKLVPKIETTLPSDSQIKPLNSKKH